MAGRSGRTRRAEATPTADAGGAGRVRGGASGAGRTRGATGGELPPLQVNLTRHVAIGTVAWAVALVVLCVLHAQLSAQGRGWWIGTAGAGVAIGLAGLAYLRATGGRGPR